MVSTAGAVAPRPRLPVAPRRDFGRLGRLRRASAATSGGAGATGSTGRDFRQPDIGDRALGRIARDGGVVADGRQAAGVERSGGAGARVDPGRSLAVGASSTGGADWLNVMPDDAVYPPERSIGLVVSRSTAVASRG